MRRRRKQSLIFGIILLIMGLGLGYAFLTTSLSIDGTAEVDSNTWDVYWDNVQVTEGSVSASTPVIDTSKTTVSFSAHLSQPGDFYEFTVEAVNDGSIDAMIDTITRTVNNSETIPDYLKYEVTYDDNVSVTLKQLLKSESKETYKVRVEYRDDIEADALPTTDQSLNLTLDVDYVQADSQAKNIRNYRYWRSYNGSYSIGDQVPALANLVCYDYIHASIKSSFFRYTYDEEGKITEIVVGLSVNAEGPIYLYPDSSQFERNVATIREAFGEENCSYQTSGDITSYSCNFGNTGGYSPMSTVQDNGYVSATNNCLNCNITITGVSHCSIVHTTECYG